MVFQFLEANTITTIQIKHKGGEVASRECPNCYSKRNWKDGLRETRVGLIQRFVCRDCGFRFSDKSYKEYLLNENRQLCAQLEAKKLDTTTETRTVAGEKNQIEQNITGKVIEYLWYLKKEGRKNPTLIARKKDLLRLQKHGANLLDPESVKEVIANENVSQNTKIHYVTSYDSFAKWLNINWKAPNYKFERKIPWLPTETQIDQLIAGCKPRMAIFLQIMKETMFRAGETWTLKWTDINGNILTLNKPEKGSNPRQFKISDRLVSMLSILPKKDERIFGPKNSLDNFRTNYIRKRKQISRTLADPSIAQITFHTFRHWGATMLFHKTKNILYVQQKLGHKCIQNTMVYTQLVNFESDEWHVAHAKTIQEEDKLIEAGFEFIRYSEAEQTAIYRKRK